MVPAGLEDGQEARDIGMDIGLRVVEGVADSRLGCEVDHDVGREGGHLAGEGPGLGNVEAHEPEARVLAQLRKAGLLEADVIVIVDVVDPEHCNALRCQARRDMETHESGRPRDEDPADAGRGFAHAGSSASMPRPTLT
jgi:hypothetical protein